MTITQSPVAGVPPRPRPSVRSSSPGRQEPWWESREQTFVDKLDIDYGAAVRLDGQRPDPPVVDHVHHLPQRAGRRLETYRGGARLHTAAPSGLPDGRIKNAGVLGRRRSRSPPTFRPLRAGQLQLDVGWQPSASSAMPSPGCRPASRPTGMPEPPDDQRDRRRRDALDLHAARRPRPARPSTRPFSPGTAAPRSTGCAGRHAAGRVQLYRHRFTVLLLRRRAGELPPLPRGLGWRRPASVYRGSLVSIAYAQKATNYCAWAGAYYGVPTP